MNNKISNPKKEVNETIEMNDKDYLSDVLETLKNMSNNLSIAINEMSNDYLYEVMFEIFTTVKDEARDAYNIMFEDGWYTLEKAESNKINESVNKLNICLSELE